MTAYLTGYKLLEKSEITPNYVKSIGQFFRTKIFFSYETTFTYNTSRSKTLRWWRRIAGRNLGRECGMSGPRFEGQVWKKTLGGAWLHMVSFSLFVCRKLQLLGFIHGIYGVLEKVVMWVTFIFPKMILLWGSNKRMELNSRSQRRHLALCSFQCFFWHSLEQ